MEDIFINNAYKILELFIQYPTKDFSVRGIARELNLNHATIINYINDLQQLSLIKKKETTLYPTYFANTENEKYKLYKKNWLVFKILNSNVVDLIQKESLPSSIILFGSGAKATFTEKSDIDIFVEAKEIKLDLTKYEKRLNHKINISFESNINDLSTELRNNIINGVVLYGFVKIK